MQKLINDQYVANIGLEIHVVIKANTKMFSSAKAEHNSEANTNLHPMDLALPGVLPTINEEVVKKAIVLATSLKMTIANTLVFDRKNYFYMDLPKGFQITQQFFPIGTNGSIQIARDKTIEIERIHIEEDTAKQFKKDGQIYLDYNRCGMALIEIVTKPNLTSANEVLLFLKKLKAFLLANDISDAKMEEGSLRVDVNVSVRKKTTETLGTRVEIKNINSFNNIKKAIENEISDLINKQENNQTFDVCTKRFDEKTQSNIFMRKKTTDVEYHYMHEFNLFPFAITKQYIDQTLANNYFDYEQAYLAFVNKQIDLKYLDQIETDIDLFKFVYKHLINTTNLNQIIGFLVNDLNAYLNKNNQTFNQLTSFQLDELLKLLAAFANKKIIHQNAKKALVDLLANNTKFDVDKYQASNNYDENAIRELLDELIKNNNELIKTYNDRKDRVNKFFVGQIMKQTKGQADPILVNQILEELILKALS